VFNKIRLNFYLLFLIILISLTLKGHYGYAQPNLALKDDHIEVLIEIEGHNIRNARDKENHIDIGLSSFFPQLDNYTQKREKQLNII